jgi:hypothetical protein
MWSGERNDVARQGTPRQAGRGSEQATGLYTMIEEHLTVPFATTVLGVPVTVECVQLTLRDEIVAVCRRAQSRQTVPLLDLPLPSPPPAGSEWISAYRHWLHGG